MKTYGETATVVDTAEAGSFGGMNYVQVVIPLEGANKKGGDQAKRDALLNAAVPSSGLPLCMMLAARSRAMIAPASDKPSLKVRGEFLRRIAVWMDEPPEQLRRCAMPPAMLADCFHCE